MIIVSKPSKAIRAPIVWNRPTAGMFDYHYDLAGLYYQVVVIALNAKALVKETDTSPSSRWSTTAKSERRVELGGWSTCQIVLSPTLTREPSEMFFLPLVFASKETTLNCDIFPLTCLWSKRNRVWLQHTRSWWRRLWQVLDDDVPTQDEGQERQIK